MGHLDDRSIQRLRPAGELRDLAARIMQACRRCPGAGTPLPLLEQKPAASPPSGRAAGSGYEQQPMMRVLKVVRQVEDETFGSRSKGPRARLPVCGIQASRERQRRSVVAIRPNYVSAMWVGAVVGFVGHTYSGLIEPPRAIGFATGVKEGVCDARKRAAGDSRLRQHPRAALPAARPGRHPG